MYPNFPINNAFIFLYNGFFISLSKTTCSLSFKNGYILSTMCDITKFLARLNMISIVKNTI